MQIPHEVRSAWKHWFDGAESQPISGGLSSSKIWRIQPALGAPCCLKAWPEEAIDAKRLLEIHQFMTALNARLSFVPKVIAPSSIDSAHCIHAMGHYWELSGWMAGRPVTPDKARLAHGEAAVRSIAQLHQVSRSWISTTGCSPSVITRLESLIGYHKRLASLRTFVHRSSAPLQRLSGLTLRHFESSSASLMAQLEQLRGPVELLWVVRDLHREHMLFEEAEVTGVIDFGAARLDEPLIDLVRLLGSLWPYSRDTRHHLLERYVDLTQRTDLLARFQALDHSSTLLSAMQWLQWLVVEQRSFAAEPAQLLQRWQQLNQRLECDQW